MTDALKPRFDWGQRVQAAVNLFNDGTYPERAADVLLVEAGKVGEIVQVGQHTDSGAFVYMVEFEPNQFVGCMEPELMILQSNQEAQ
jgi:nitrogen fixation protein NifZ